MEKQLREHLLENEQLLWTGRPEAFETLDKSNKTSIMVGLVIKLVVSLGILLLYGMSARQDGGNIKPIVIVFILAIAAFAIVNPFVKQRTTSYAGGQKSLSYGQKGTSFVK